MSDRGWPLLLAALALLLLLAALAVLLAGGAGGLVMSRTPPTQASPLSAPVPEPATAEPTQRDDELTARQVESIDPEREPQRWVDAVDALRARLDRFATDSTLGHARRREEGEDLLRLVDAFAAKGFYLPGQASQVKLEIARQIYGDDPELMAQLTREFESDALQQVERFENEREAELVRDPRFQRYRAQEAALIESMRATRPAGPERDAALAAAAAELHRRIFGAPAP